MNKQFNEHKKRILDAGYKYASLWRGTERICAWNNSPKNIDEKLNEIEARLNNIAPGEYVMRARNSTSEKLGDPFVIDTSNNLAENKGTHQVIYKEPASDKLLENKQILELTVRVKELEMQNEYLRGQIDDLENELAELEAKAADAPELGEQTPAPGLLESAKDFLGSLMEFGAPLLDQHFALKQQQLEIERMKLNARRPAPGTPQAQKDENVKIRIIGEFVETFQDTPEIYEALHEISAKSQSVQEFMNYLQQFNQGIYEQLSVKIWPGTKQL